MNNTVAGEDIYRAYLRLTVIEKDRIIITDSFATARNIKKIIALRFTEQSNSSFYNFSRIKIRALQLGLNKDSVQYN